MHVAPAIEVSVQGEMHAILSLHCRASISATWIVAPLGQKRLDIGPRLVPFFSFTT